MRLNEFLSRFLYQPNPPLVSLEDYADNKVTHEEYCKATDKWWENPDSPPAPQVVEEALGVAKERLGFDAHEAAFSALAEVMDACVAEEMPLRGFGQAGKNAKKHPRVIALSKAGEATRSQVALAAAQGLLWMEDCRKWCHDAHLRTQIQKRVMTAAIVLVAEKKTLYTPAELSILAGLGASLKDGDVFVLGVRAAIVEILMKHLKELPRDSQTVEACKRFLDAPDIFASKRLQEARSQLEAFLTGAGTGVR